MPMNPVQFSHQVCDEYLRYLFSAFPLSDPDLERQAPSPAIPDEEMGYTQDAKTWCCATACCRG